MSNKSINSAQSNTLYYDGSCPICSGEICKLESLVDNGIEFIDINSTDDLPINKELLFSELHLFKPDGQVLKGLEANVAAWQHTKWRRVAGLLLLPGIRFFSEKAYEIWLFWYKRSRAKRLSSTI